MNKIINVNTREEFVSLLRSEFIPSCNEDGLLVGFNLGYAFRNWTSFWYYKNDVFITVNLI